MTEQKNSELSANSEQLANRWLASYPDFSVDQYEAKFTAIAAEGKDVHGEANFVLSLQPTPSCVLDAGCGAGRVAIELARHGVQVTGADIDERMLARARAKAPELTWHLGDLALLKFEQTFDAIVVAGNVMIYLTPGLETQTVVNLSKHLKVGGYLVAGFRLNAQYSLADYDKATEIAGLTLVERWSTWERTPWHPDAGFAVSVHRR